jgi:hypothetical protein
MLYREVIVGWSDIHTKHINTLCRQKLEFVNLKVVVYSNRTAQKTHSVSVIQTNQLMLYSEIIAVCSEIHTIHINTVRTAK